jgi:hypothetical protein
MARLVDQMIGTLLEGAKAICRELELMVEAQAVQSSALAHLGSAARSFGDQADTLAVLLGERTAEQVLVNQVEELATFFRRTEQRITIALLAAFSGPGPSRTPERLGGQS